jgi:hypothetical protein
VLAIGCAILAAVPAAHAQTQARLPGPLTPVRSEPPLVTGVPRIQPRFVGPVDSWEVVNVEIDERGVPRRVSVVQRLLVHGVGDYYFGIPAPATSVRAADGTRSEPGRRPGQILWQGFSPGNRVLAASVGLDPAAAARHLPLLVIVSRKPGLVLLTIRNATFTRVPSFTAAADPRQVARFLDLLRDPPARLVPDTFVTVSGQIRQRSRVAVAPLQVSGALEFPAGALAGARASGGTVTGSRVTFAGLVMKAPLRVEVRLSGTPRPRLRLVADPELPAARLRPPTGRTWMQYVGDGRGIEPRELLDTALGVALDAAVASHYDTLLANPDRTGKRTGRYVYTSATPEVRTPGAERQRNGGRSWLASVAIAVGLLAGGAAGIVWWAHS